MLSRGPDLRRQAVQPLLSLIPLVRPSLPCSSLHPLLHSDYSSFPHFFAHFLLSFVLIICFSFPCSSFPLPFHSYNLSFPILFLSPSLFYPFLSTPLFFPPLIHPPLLPLLLPFPRLFIPYLLTFSPSLSLSHSSYSPFLPLFLPFVFVSSFFISFSHSFIFLLCLCLASPLLHSLSLSFLSLLPLFLISRFLIIFLHLYISFPSFPSCFTFFLPFVCLFSL